MKIKFKKKYDDGVTWCAIVEDFLKVVSEKYGYTIDAFDMMALPDLIIQHRIGELLCENSESVTYNREYWAHISKTLEAKKFAAETRAKRKKVWEAMNVFEKLEETNENNTDD